MQELPSWRYLPEGANARNVPVEKRSDAQGRLLQKSEGTVQGVPICVCKWGDS